MSKKNKQEKLEEKLEEKELPDSDTWDGFMNKLNMLTKGAEIGFTDIGFKFEDCDVYEILNIDNNNMYRVVDIDMDDPDANIVIHKKTIDKLVKIAEFLDKYNIKYKLFYYG